MTVRAFLFLPMVFILTALYFYKLDLYFSIFAIYQQLKIEDCKLNICGILSILNSLFSLKKR